LLNFKNYNNQPLKIKDLKDLCQLELIPEQYHQFYFTLFDNGNSNNCDLAIWTLDEEVEFKD